MRRTRHYRFSEGESGFTLPELTMVIVLMGIVAGIAIPSWFGLIESRQVDSATNQLVSDLRLAHSTATNRLANQVVTLTDGNSTYTRGADSRDLSDDPGQEIVVDTDVVITFKSDGSATADPIGAGSFGVVSANDSSLEHTIKVNAATSRVQVDS